MKKIDWKMALTTTALYASAGGVAGFAGAGAEHSDSAAVEGVFTTTAGRWRGARRGAMAGGSFAIGLLGAFAAVQGRGTTRAIGVGGAALGFGALIWQLSDLIRNRTAEETTRPLPQQTQTQQSDAGPALADTNSGPPANTALDAATEASLDQLGVDDSTVSDEALLSLTGLGRGRSNRRMTHAYSRRYV